MEKNDALSALAALAQSTRLDVFRLLVTHGERGATAGDIAEHLSVLQNTLSAHLSILAHADLVTAEREGRSIRYRANFDTMRDMLRFLLQDCCQASDVVCEPLLAAMTCR